MTSPRWNGRNGTKQDEQNACHRDAEDAAGSQTEDSRKVRIKGWIEKSRPADSQPPHARDSGRQFGSRTWTSPPPCSAEVVAIPSALTRPRTQTNRERRVKQGFRHVFSPRQSDETPKSSAGDHSSATTGRFLLIVRSAARFHTDRRRDCRCKPRAGNAADSPKGAHGAQKRAFLAFFPHSGGVTVHRSGSHCALAAQCGGDRSCPPPLRPPGAGPGGDHGVPVASISISR